MDKKVGIASLVVSIITLVVVISLSILSLLVVVSFSILALPPVHDILWEKHPDTQIYSLVTEHGPFVFVCNRGEKIDKVNIHIGVQPDVIESYDVSNEEEVRLILGGVGETHANFTIDELSPSMPHYIQIVTQSDVKVMGTVKGWSVHKGDIKEEIAIVEVRL